MSDPQPASALPAALQVAARAIPVSARIYSCLQSLLQSPVASVGDVVDLVKLDAGLASAVLRAANSAYHRAGEPLESVNDAINRVGLREVHRIVGYAVAGELFVSTLPLYGLGGRLLWENSLATAVAMSVLAHVAGVDERPAYTLGLLRPAGCLVLQRVALAGSEALRPRPEPSAAAPFAEGDWERAQFGFGNHELTAHLLCAWHFAPTLVAAARHHLRPEKAAGEAAARLAARLHLAAWISETLGKGLPAERFVWRCEPSLVALAGLAPETPQSCLLDVRSELNRLGSQVRAPAAV